MSHPTVTVPAYHLDGPHDGSGPEGDFVYYTVRSHDKHWVAEAHAPAAAVAARLAKVVLADIEAHHGNRARKSTRKR